MATGQRRRGFQSCTYTNFKLRTNIFRTPQYKADSQREHVKHKDCGCMCVCVNVVDSATTEQDAEQTI